MPKIQIYESQVEAQSPQAPQVQIEDFTGGWQNATDAFKTIDATVKEFKKVRDFNEVSEAELGLRAEIGAIEQQAANEKDLNKLEYYRAKIDDAISRHSGKISDKLVQSEVRASFNLTGYSSYSKITNDFRKKSIDVGQAAYMARANEYATAIANAQSQTEKDKAEADWVNAFNEARAAGIYSEKDLVGLQIAHQEEVKTAQKTKVQYDIQSDNARSEEDSSVLAELRKADGQYSYLDNKTRLGLIQDAQRRIFQNNQTFKRDAEISRNERFDEIFTKSYNGTLSLSDIDRELETPEEFGGIPRKQLIDIKEGIQKRVKSDLAVIVEDDAKAAEYLRFIDNFISDENDRQKGREFLATAFKDQILSDKEASFLNSIKREAEDIEYGRKYQESWNPLKGAIKYIGEQMRGRKTATEADAALAIKKLIAGLSAGKDPKIVQKQILTEDAIKRNPSIVGIPDEGTEYMDDNGAIKMVLPDGTWKSPKFRGEK